MKRFVTTYLILSTVSITLPAQAPFAIDEPRDSAVIHDIETRMRVASGTLITASDAPARDASVATDLVRFARGFRWRNPTSVTTRGSAVGMSRSARCESIPRADSIPVRGSKAVAIYLDGSRLPGGLEMINKMVPAGDVLAVEAYPDVLSAPPLWRTNDACAVIAFWTKR
jgi:hypothetical protein